MPYRRRGPCAALAVALCLGTSGGGHAASLRIGNDGAPETLDPHQATEIWETRILRDLFMGLTADAADGSVVPGVAESWTIGDDGLTWTFALRDHLWSDGEPVTADDFVFSLRRLFDPAIAAPLAPALYAIDNAQALNEGAVLGMEQLGVRALDERTLEITLGAPVPYLAEQLTHHAALPVPRHAIEAHGDAWTQPDHMVSNGAYVVTEWRPDGHVRLEKNPKFPAAEEVAIDEVHYHPIGTRARALERYLAGELDIATDFPSDRIEPLRSEIPKEVHITPAPGTAYYAFNVRRPPFDDAGVRQALAMAIEQPAITGDVLRSGEVPAYSLVPPGTANYGEPALAPWEEEPYSERLVRAQDLLAAAGYGPTSPLEVRLRYNTSPHHKQVAIAIVQMWQQIGVRTELSASEVEAHYRALQAGDFEVARAGWLADHDDPREFLFLMESAADELNYAGYANPEFDRLMDEAARTTDLRARAELLRRAEAIAMEDQPYTPVYHYVWKNLVKPYVAGWVDNVENVHPSRHLSLAR